MQRESESVGLLSKMWKAISTKRTGWGWFFALISALFYLSDRWDSLTSFYEKLKTMGPVLKFAVDAAQSPLVQLAVFIVGVIWIGVAAILSAKASVPRPALAIQASPKPKTAKEPKSADRQHLQKIPRLHDLYLSDFNRLISCGRESKFKSHSGEVIRTPYRVHMNFESKSKFISVYVPHSSFGYMTYEICKKIPDLCEVYLRDAADRVFVGSRDPADSSMEGSDQLIFTGKIFVYHEDELSLEELGSLEALYKSKKLFPQFRGLNYVTTRWLQRKSTS